MLQQLLENMVDCFTKGMLFALSFCTDVYILKILHFKLVLHFKIKHINQESVQEKVCIVGVGRKFCHRVSLRYHKAFPLMLKSDQRQ